MKVRPARGMGTTLDESLEQAFDVPDMAALLEYLKREYYFWEPTAENVSIAPYGFDARCGWDTHLICIDGKAALFSDGPLPTADRAKDAP